MKQRWMSVALRLSLLQFAPTAAGFSNRFNPDRYKAAKAKLLWKTFEESNARPILNRSTRNASPVNWWDKRTDVSP